MPVRIRSFLPMREKLARNLPGDLAGTCVENVVSGNGHAPLLCQGRQPPKAVAEGQPLHRKGAWPQNRHRGWWQARGALPGGTNAPGIACVRFIGKNYGFGPALTTIPTSGEVQGLGPWRGLGQRPNLPLPQRQMVGATAYNSTTAPIPQSGFVLGSRAAVVFLGRYDFSLPDTFMNGGLRPLRNPISAWDFRTA